MAECRRRDVLESRWTFEIVERFDDDYYEGTRSEVMGLEQRLVAGRRHVHEEALRHRRRAEHPPFLPNDAPDRLREATVIAAEGTTTIDRPADEIIDFVLDLNRYKQADTKITRVLASRFDGDTGEVRYAGRLRGIPGPAIVNVASGVASPAGVVTKTHNRTGTGTGFCARPCTAHQR